MNKLDNELVKLGFVKNRASNWTRKHDIVQVVRSKKFSEQLLLITWREYWKNYLVLIFDYSPANGPICIVPTSAFFNSGVVNEIRKRQSYVNSGNYWFQDFKPDHELSKLVQSYENRWDILGGKVGYQENENQQNAKLAVVNKETNSEAISVVPAQLTCTIEDFHTYIGDKIKNRIPYITRKERNNLNKVCQNCKKTVMQLDSAHVRGFERDKIIDNIIKNYIVDEKKQLIQVDLHKVVPEILEAHQPVSKYFRFLCRSCHKKYDNGTLQLG
jgi:hypothetical protein